MHTFVFMVDRVVVNLCLVPIVTRIIAAPTIPVVKLIRPDMDHGVVMPEVWVECGRSNCATDIESASKADERLDIVEGLDAATLEFLSPSVRHEIMVNPVKQGTVIIVHLLHPTIV